MANIGTTAIKLIDSDGDAMDSGGALKVDIVSSSASIDLGDVSLLLGGTAASVGAGTYTGGGTLRVTLANNDVLTTVANNSLSAIETDTGTIAGDTTEIAGYFSQTGSAYAQRRGIAPMVLRNDELAAIPAGVDDGDYTELQVDSIGGLYVTGSEVENAAVQSEPLLIGGRYDSSPRSLGSGDAGAIALNASGHVLMDVVDGGQLDALLDTIKVDTEAIETAVEILDNAIDGSEMQVDIVSGSVGHDITGGADGVTVVSTAGSHVELASSTACKKVDIQAQTDNTGLIAVGFDNVDATEATGTGVILYSGDTYSLEISNLNLIYVDATVSGEGVRYTYFT